MGDTRNNGPKVVKRTVALVGMANSGKTELMYSLREKSTKPFNSQYIPTIGAAFTRCEWKNQVTGGEVVDHLTLLDTSGMPKYLYMLKHYLGLSQLNTKDTVLLTLDPTPDSRSLGRKQGDYLKEQEDYLREAAKLCATCCPKAKFILAITKNDVDEGKDVDEGRWDEDFNRTRLNRLANTLSKELGGSKIGVVYCSAKTGNGLEELSSRLTSYLPDELKAKVSKKASIAMAKMAAHDELVNQIEKNVIQILITEQQRLLNTYRERQTMSGQRIINDENARVRSEKVGQTIQALNDILAKVKSKEIPIETREDKEKLKKELEESIEERLADFNKYTGGGFRKLVQICLDAIAACFPSPTKKNITQTAGAWLKLGGKTSVVGNVALKNVRKIIGPGK